MPDSPLSTHFPARQPRVGGCSIDKTLPSILRAEPCAIGDDEPDRWPRRPGSEDGLLVGKLQQKTNLYLHIRVHVLSSFSILRIFRA